MKLYLHQYLSKTGAFNSKNIIMRSIQNGEIKLDDRIITNPNFQFNPKRKKVFFKGLQLKEVEHKVYIIINKPAGYISMRKTKKDILLKKKSIFELFSNDLRIDDKTRQTLCSVGRLDENTSGLLIITNDGMFNHRISNPAKQIKKTYEAFLLKPITQSDIEKIIRGIKIDIGENKEPKLHIAKPAKLICIDPRRVQITLTEGKKREVRKIFESVGNFVLKLERIAIGGLLLKEIHLKEGAYIFCSKEYIEEKIK